MKRVSKEEFSVAKKMKERGYVYAVEFPGDDRILYFKTVKDFSSYLWDETTLAPKWNGKIDDLDAE